MNKFITPMIFLLFLVGIVSAAPTFTFNTPDSTGSYQFNDSSPTINVSVVNASDSTNENISIVKFLITNTSFAAIATDLLDTNITMSNGTNTDYNYTFTADFDSLPIGDYNLTVWANDTDGVANTSTIQFTILNTSTSVVETYIATLGSFTANFRNANNTADISTDMDNSTTYTVVFDITSQSQQLTVGKFTGPSWSTFSSIDPATTVGTGNDPSYTSNTKRVWLDASMFTTYSWAKVNFSGYYDKKYRLTGTSSSPTWTEIQSVCTNGTAYEYGTNTSNELPCYWTNNDGNTYIYMSSFSGAAVADYTGGGTILGGVSSARTTATQPVSPIIPTPEEIKESGDLGELIFTNFGYIFVGIVAAVYLLFRKRK